MNSAGDTVGRMPRPWAEDSFEGEDDGNEHVALDCWYKLEAIGDGVWVVTIVLPEGYLDSAVYPVIVDPNLEYTTTMANAGYFSTYSLRANNTAVTGSPMWVGYSGSSADTEHIAYFKLTDMGQEYLSAISIGRLLSANLNFGYKSKTYNSSTTVRSYNSTTRFDTSTAGNPYYVYRTFSLFNNMCSSANLAESVVCPDDICDREASLEISHDTFTRWRFSKDESRKGLLLDCPSGKGIRLVKSTLALQIRYTHNINEANPDPIPWSQPIWPLGDRFNTKEFISSPWGVRNEYGPFHYGFDIRTAGSYVPVYAVMDAVVKVVVSNSNEGYGKYIILEHDDRKGNTISTLYAHLSEVDVRKDDVVRQGQQIGVSGNTGNSSGAHLHFEVYSGNTFSSRYATNMNGLEKYHWNDVRSGGAGSAASVWTNTWSEGDNPNPMFEVRYATGTFYTNPDFSFVYTVDEYTATPKNTHSDDINKFNAIYKK